MQEKFNISNGVDGSAVSYNINYTDADSNVCAYTCITIDTSESSCRDDVCKNELEVSSSHCNSSSNINITVTGTYRLGSGLPSMPVTIGNYVSCYIVAKLMIWILHNTCTPCMQNLPIGLLKCQLISPKEV